MNIINTEFTYWEFINYMKETEKMPRIIENKDRDGYNSSSKQSRKKTIFTETESFEQALELAVNGWDAGLEQLPISDGVLSGSGVEFNQSVQGAVVNVPNYLQGLPDSMWEMSEKREYNLPEIEVYVPLTCNSNNAGSDMLKRCMEIIEYINKMQQTHQLKIIGVFDSVQSSGEGRGVNRIINNIVIKDFNERFVLNNIAFAFHPSFFRRLDFRFSESTKYHEPYSYGYTTELRDIISYIRKSSKGKSLILPGVQYYRHWNEEDIIKINH